jgi:hypothetical protein
MKLTVGYCTRSQSYNKGRSRAEFRIAQTVGIWIHRSVTVTSEIVLCIQNVSMGVGEINVKEGPV